MIVDSKGALKRKRPGDVTARFCSLSSELSHLRDWVGQKGGAAASIFLQLRLSQGTLAYDRHSIGNSVQNQRCRVRADKPLDHDMISFTLAGGVVG